MFKTKKGFTAIEAIVIIAVVAVIGGIVWYTLGNKAGADNILISNNSKNSPVAISNVKLLDKNGSSVSGVKPGQSIIVAFDMTYLSSSHYDGTTVTAQAFANSNKTLYAPGKEVSKKTLGNKTISKVQAELITNSADLTPANTYAVYINATATSNASAYDKSTATYPPTAQTFFTDPSAQ